LGATESTLDTYSAFIGSPVSLVIQAVAGATRYEWQFEHAQTGTVEVVSTSGPLIVWSATKAGHFFVTVRACNANGCGLPAAGVAENFWLHFWIAPPGF
jgi:hypothetical protein